jgi:antitoxin FitA
MYIACMPNVQVRDVPDDVHAALVRRAEQAGQSLQQYLAAQLAMLAATPTLDEILARIEQHRGGHLTAAESVSALQAERDRR